MKLQIQIQTTKYIVICLTILGGKETHDLLFVHLLILNLPPLPSSKAKKFLELSIALHPQLLP
jgi:hypothetical protein